MFSVYGQSMYRKADKDFKVVLKFLLTSRRWHFFGAAGPPPGRSRPTEINGPKLPEMDVTQLRILLVLHKAPYILPI